MILFLLQLFFQDYWFDCFFYSGAGTIHRWQWSTNSCLVSIQAYFWWSGKPMNSVALYFYIYYQILLSCAKYWVGLSGCRTHAGSGQLEWLSYIVVFGFASCRYQACMVDFHTFNFYTHNNSSMQVTAVVNYNYLLVWHLHFGQFKCLWFVYLLWRFNLSTIPSRYYSVLFTWGSQLNYIIRCDMY